MYLDIYERNTKPCLKYNSFGEQYDCSEEPFFFESLSYSCHSLFFSF